MSDAAMEFSNRVGQELFQLLRSRVSEQLAGEEDSVSYSAALGAALITVGEVLRDPVEKGADPNKLVELASRWLSTLLDQIRDEHQRSA